MTYKYNPKPDEEAQKTMAQLRKKKTCYWMEALLLALCFSLIHVLADAAAFKQQNKLRFSKEGQFKILQVADMHFGDGKSTPCLDVLPSQMPGCSDLNTSAFIHRMIQAEKPHLIVFTGIFFHFLDHIPSVCEISEPSEFPSPKNFPQNP